MTDFEGIQGMTIGDASREALIDEIMFHQREMAQTYAIEELRAAVVQYRVADVRKRLEREAGIKVTRGLFGDSVTSEGGE